MLFPQTLPGHSNPPAADPKRISTPATGSEETRGARPSTPLIKTSSASPSRQTLAAPEESGEAIRPVASARPLRPDAVDEESREQATPFVRPAAVEPRAGQLETEGETTVVNLEIVPLPHASNRLQPASVREGSAQAAAPPPTIEVTIGRIEVRAVTPPVPPPQQRVRESPPKMSLDDYLRANSGGRK
jgi:hypothetical protein